MAKPPKARIVSEAEEEEVTTAPPSQIEPSSIVERAPIEGADLDDGLIVANEAFHSKTLDYYLFDNVRNENF